MCCVDGPVLDRLHTKFGVRSRRPARLVGRPACRVHRPACLVGRPACLVCRPACRPFPRPVRSARRSLRAGSWRLRRTPRSHDGGGGTGRPDRSTPSVPLGRGAGRREPLRRFAFGSASSPNTAAICGSRSATRLIAATSSSLGFSGMDCGVTTRRTGAKDNASSTVAHRSGAVSAVSAAVVAPASRVARSGGNGEPALGGRELSRSTTHHSIISQRGRHFGQPGRLLLIDPPGQRSA